MGLLFPHSHAFRKGPSRSTTTGTQRLMAWSSLAMASPSSRNGNPDHCMLKPHGLTHAPRR